MALFLSAAGAVAARPAAASINDCGGDITHQTSHGWSVSSCLSWSPYDGIKGDAFYRFFPDQGFMPSHVKKCRIVRELRSSYGTTHLNREDCTSEARAANQAFTAHTILWGFGRASGDLYGQWAWIEVTTGVHTYSSRDQASIAVISKP